MGIGPTLRRMPVEFLTDDEAAGFGRYAGVPSLADLERVFFLDDEDRVLIDRHRGEHMKLGFALQLVTVRWVGAFLEDPLDVPVAVLDFVAEQLEIADPSCVKRYTERGKTRFDHQWEIRLVCELKEFAAVEPELRGWAAARSWTSGDGPKAIFIDAVGWLRNRDVLLPGVSTLTRLVAQVRDDTTRRLWSVLEGLLTVGRRYVLDQLLEVPPGSRVSDLGRWRKGPPPRGSGPTMIKALDQIADVMGLGMGDLGAEDLVPPRRLGELAKYGMSADASQIRRHPDGRRMATLLATVRLLEAKSVDHTLELLDLLMATELLNKAQTAANKEKVRKHPKLAKASARLAVAVEALFESDGWGDSEEDVHVAAVWEAIEAVVSRSELRAALVLVKENVPPADASDPDDWRKELLGRYTTVSGFLKVLPKVISFGANAEGAAVLAAMEMLPDVLTYRSRLPAPLIPARMIDATVVNGPWKRPVFGHPAHEDGAVNRHAYAFCVLEQFYRHLKRREIHADASTRWRNPQARLLEGDPWDTIRPDVLTTLGLPENPDALLADHARTLDSAYREVGGRLAVSTEVRVDDAGKIHLTGVKAVEEPPSLAGLRARTTAMLPRVDLPEVILEVMSWEPSLVDAFIAVSGGRPRRPAPAGGPAHLDRCLPGRTLHERRVPADRQEGRPRAGTLAAVARVPELLPARDPRRGERAAGRPPGRASPGPSVGRRPGRRGRRNAVRRPGALGVRPAQSQVLRLPARHDLAQRHERPGDRTRREGRVRHRPRLPPYGRRHLRPGRRGTPRDRRVRHRLLQRPGLRPPGTAGDLLPACPGRPARPEGLADQSGRRLRPLEHLRPREDRPGEGAPELGRHIAGRRLDLHRHRPRLRRHHHAPARRSPHRARRGHRRLRPDLQVPAPPQLHRRRRDLPPRHQGHPQPPGRPPRPRPQDPARRASSTTDTNAAWRTSSASWGSS